MASHYQFPSDIQQQVDTLLEQEYIWDALLIEEKLPSVPKSMSHSSKSFCRRNMLCSTYQPKSAILSSRLNAIRENYDAQQTLQTRIQSQQPTSNDEDEDEDFVNINFTSLFPPHVKKFFDKLGLSYKLSSERYDSPDLKVLLNIILGESSDAKFVVAYPEYKLISKYNVECIKKIIKDLIGVILPYAFEYMMLIYRIIHTNVEFSESKYFDYYKCKLTKELNKFLK